MATDVEIANTALRRLGANRIVSFTDGTKSSDSVSEFYDETRDDLLRAHNWNFATQRVKLARLATVPAFGFSYAYGLPSDWLRTVSVHDNDAGDGAVEYKEEYLAGQNVLLCSAEDVYLRYVSKITDPNRMPPDFRLALSRKLAAAMAVDLAKSNTLQETCAKEAESITRRAKSADAMGSTPERRPRGSWADIRSRTWR